MNALHLIDVVDILNTGECWGRKKNRLVLHRGSPVVASLKRNENQRYNRYGLKYYLLSSTSIELIAS